MLERAKNEFIATATHGLKNTLTKITLMSQLIPRLGRLNEKQTEYIEDISETAGAMDRLVQNLLELARADAGSLESKRAPVQVNELVSEIAQEFQVQANARQQSLLLKTAIEQPVIQGDPIKLQQALRNLMSNAIKYTPENGSIVLSVQASPETVTIKVEDNGFGIPQKDLPFIFGRFFRAYTDEVKDIEGNGLGLAIVKTIVEQHAGHVSVESEIGKGSCFSIVLPVGQSLKFATSSES
jgi:signal transduction histidine kinase